MDTNDDTTVHERLKRAVLDHALRALEGKPPAVTTTEGGVILLSNDGEGYGVAEERKAA